MDQGNLSLGAPAAVTTTLFDDRTLATLAAVNEEFLRLLTELYAARPGEPVLGIASHHLRTLAGAGAQRRRVLARVPFTLFDLRLRDDRWWEWLAGSAAAVNDGVALRVDASVAEFAKLALTCAWHLAGLSEPAVRIAFGVGDGALCALQRLSLGEIGPLALRAAAGIDARFGASDAFWRLLARHAIAQDPEAAQGLRLIGLQLIGMEAARARGWNRRGRRLAVP